MSALERYLRELRDVRSTGAAVRETSYYPALLTLLNDVGKMLRPRVRCIINIQNRGAGLPDGGLFTPDQFPSSAQTSPLQGQAPARGAIEAKGTGDNARAVAQSDQVARYVKGYGQVLVTNLRDFVLVGRGPNDAPVILETYELAPSEAAFWTAAVAPQTLAATHEERFVEFLKRVMLRPAPLTEPRELAWFLASYAKEARLRIGEQSLPALADVRRALEDALGLTFQGQEGEHFFRSTLVQTLFYGVFSAWVLWSKRYSPTDTSAQFDWRTAMWELHVPMIRVLFEQVVLPSRLRPLNLEEVLQWTADTLNRVDRAAFFARFDQGQAIQYFYEPFLEAFDPELRKALGVWYTPREIVAYQVARVDTALREELSVPDGLADPRVYVLDPCCGTGTYLVETLKRISATLQSQGDDALVSADVKRAAMERVFGFEILPAPFVVAHLQLGLLLQNLGAPLADASNERVGGYLTNALTGWEPPEGPKQLMFRELEEERDAADKVKRETPILVVLGNPPYNAYAGVSPVEEGGLVEPYKEGLVREWGIKKFNLDDLYVRFFRVAERRIAEQTGRGVVCYISNYSWLSDPSFVVLRRHLLETFDRFWIDDLHGNRVISERAPDGTTSETVFATPGMSVGIRQGVAISLWVRRDQPHGAPRALFRDTTNAARAVARREQLLASLSMSDFDAQYEAVTPVRENRFSLRPTSVALNYEAWPNVEELAEFKPSPGLLEKRKRALLDSDRDALTQRMQTYYDSSIDWDTLKLTEGRLTDDAARFDARAARTKIIGAERFNQGAIRKMMVAPMDTVWTYYSRGKRSRPWDEERPGGRLTSRSGLGTLPA
jgi:hypothetical protein